MSEVGLLSAVLKSPVATVGAVALAYYFARFAYAVLRAFRAFFLPSKVDFKSHGQWAVVTGSTDGIGKAYAEQLAQKGMDVVLISRSEQKLRAVASAIESTYRVKTKTVIADFSQGPEIYPDIGRQLAGLDIGVLVNNVGMSNEHPEYFHSVRNREEVYASMINCNMLSVTEMTGLILPQMIAKKKGVLINLSSGSAMFTVPLLSVYAATKNYVTSLTKTLQVEYASQGVIIQHVFPLFVSTNMSKIKRASFSVPSAETFVRSALGSVGVLDSTPGCFSHWLQFCFIQALPGWFRSALTKRVMLGSRASALRKAARAAKQE